jgi:uncharacterized membrane protein
METNSIIVSQGSDLEGTDRVSEIQPSSPQTETADSGVSNTERWASIIGGSAMVLMGLQQRSLRGILTAIAGGSMAYHGIADQKSISERVEDVIGAEKSIKVEKTVTINKPAEELYQFWRDFTNLPTFMKHLQSVSVLDDRRSHWVANAPLGATVEWDAEMISDQPNALIAWASIEGSDIENSGFVRFQNAPGDRGTEVKVVLEYSIPGGALTATVAKLFGEEPNQQVSEDLGRFKMLMETGEIATTEGQSRGKA